MAGKFEEYDYVKFKNRLKEISNHEKQCDIANKIDITPSTLSKYLNGDMHPPIQVLLHICSIYGCSLDDLLGRESAQEKASVSNEYSCFSDFASDFFQIYENEECQICKLNDDSNYERYCISFANKRINKLLKQIYSIETLEDKTIFEQWKSGVLSNGVIYKKENDYRDFDEEFPELLSKLADEISKNK